VINYTSMKSHKLRVLILLVSAFFLLSCGDNTPTEKEMKDRQIAYEKKKEEISANLGKLYLSEKEQLFNKLSGFEYALDTTSSKEEVNSDTNFVYAHTIKKVVFRENRLGIKVETNNEGFLTLKRNGEECKNVPKIIEMLRVCKDTGIDEPCFAISDQSIRNFLNLDLVFVQDIVLDIEPKISTSGGVNSFETGFRVASTTCYDINKRNKVFRFVTTATNSENVSIRGGFERVQLKRDLNMRFNSAYIESLHKNFNLSD